MSTISKGRRLGDECRTNFCPESRRKRLRKGSTLLSLGMPITDLTPAIEGRYWKQIPLGKVMKPAGLHLALIWTFTLLCGCKTYHYQLTQPPQFAKTITEQPANITFEPLEYHLQKRNERLAIQIVNPTSDRIVLEGNRSYVVDPNGESHPLPAKVIAPHSHAQLFLPPRPNIVQSPTVAYGYGWGWGPGPWPPYGPGFYYGYYGPYYSATPIEYQIVTPYDWNWHTGPVRVRFSYEQSGKTFEHDFEFDRELDK